MGSYTTLALVSLVTKFLPLLVIAKFVPRNVDVDELQRKYLEPEKKGEARNNNDLHLL